VFKRSAEKLAAAVKAAKPTATVVINEDKVCWHGKTNCLHTTTHPLLSPGRAPSK
jgi:hypothetical protein